MRVIITFYTYKTVCILFQSFFRRVVRHNYNVLVFLHGRRWDAGSSLHETHFCVYQVFYQHSLNLMLPTSETKTKNYTKRLNRVVEP